MPKTAGQSAPLGNLGRKITTGGTTVNRPANKHKVRNGKGGGKTSY